MYFRIIVKNVFGDFIFRTSKLPNAAAAELVFKAIKTGFGEGEAQVEILQVTGQVLGAVISPDELGVLATNHIVASGLTE